MKQLKFTRICGYVISFLLLVSMSALTSCKPRTARILSKIAHDVEHATEEREEQNSSAYQDDEGTNTDVSEEVERIYAVDGICYSERDGSRGEINTNNLRAVKTGGKFYLEYCEMERYPVSRNNVSTIMSNPTLSDVPMDGSETPDKVVVNVSSYEYKSHDNDGNIYYFNIYQ